MYRAQFQIYQGAFPSPQWGDCSKTQNKYISYATSDVSVPIMGSNSKDEIHAITDKNLYEFQSPQWGSNSKGRISQYD